LFCEDELGRWTILCRGEPAGEAHFMSDEYFTVDGTLARHADPARSHANYRQPFHCPKGSAAPAPI